MLLIYKWGKKRNRIYYGLILFDEFFEFYIFLMCGVSMWFTSCFLFFALLLFFCMWCYGLILDMWVEELS